MFLIKSQLLYKAKKSSFLFCFESLLKFCYFLVLHVVNQCTFLLLDSFFTELNSLTIFESSLKMNDENFGPAILKLWLEATYCYFIKRSMLSVNAEFKI
jgi:hypothetical protein